jgi:hypothetical protein
VARAWSSSHLAHKVDMFLFLQEEEEYSGDDSLAAEDPNHKARSQPKKDNEADFFGFGKSLTVKGRLLSLVTLWGDCVNGAELICLVGWDIKEVS